MLSIDYSQILDAAARRAATLKEIERLLAQFPAEIAGLRGSFEYFATLREQFKLLDEEGKIVLGRDLAYHLRGALESVEDLQSRVDNPSGYFQNIEKILRGEPGPERSW